MEKAEEVAELQQLRSTLSLTYGPLGVGAMVQSTPGRGHVTLTSVSQRLLPMLRTSSAMGPLLVDSLVSHCQTRRDSGLFAGLLTTNLILNGLDLCIPQHQVAMVTSHALSLVSNRLQSEEPVAGSGMGRERLELSSHLQLSSLLRTFLSSKTAIAQLSNSDVDHLTSLLLKGFLVAVPQKPGVSFAVSDRVSVHVSLGQPVSESCLKFGLLLELPAAGREWEVEGRGQAGEGCGQAGEGCGQAGEGCGQAGKGCGGREDILTALFDISLAGDLPDEFPRDVQLLFTGEEELLTTVSSDGGLREEPMAGGSNEGQREVESSVLRELMRLGAGLVEAGVGFVGCQKVVHPLLKDYWRENGVFVVDRLSAASLGPMSGLTGSRIISSLSPNLSPNPLGRLGSITHTSVHGKRYVVLEGGRGDRGSHCSLMLSCQTQAVADELHLLCSSALQILQQSLSYPYVLCGGGCTETLISHFLCEKASEDHSSDFFDDLRCNEKTFRAVMRSVAASFQRVAGCLEHHGGTVVSDSWSHHCWFFPPANWSRPRGCHHLTSKCELSNIHEEKGRDTGRRAPEDRCCIPARNAEDLTGVCMSDSVGTDCGRIGHCVPAGKRRERGQCVLRCSGLEKGGDVRWTGGKDVRTREQSEERNFLEDSRRNEEVEEGVQLLEKRCGCGRVKLSDLPPTCKWVPLGTDRCSIFVPDFLQECLQNDAQKTDSFSNAAGSRPFPLVCDPFLPKVRAIEIANDLASTILRISFSKP